MNFPESSSGNSGELSAPIPSSGCTHLRNMQYSLTIVGQHSLHQRPDAGRGIARAAINRCSETLTSSGSTTTTSPFSPSDSVVSIASREQSSSALGGPDHPAARRHESHCQGRRCGAVAKDPGVLVLSRFAGTARELDGALVVNPYDVEGVAERLEQALTMPLKARREPWRSMYKAIAENDVTAWREKLLLALQGGNRVH